MVVLVGGDWADTELVEAVVVVVVVVSVDGFDDDCCVHTSEIGRTGAGVATTLLWTTVATPAGFAGVTDTPGEPCGVLLLLSLMVCCDCCLGKEHNTHIGGRYKEMESDSGG